MKGDYIMEKHITSAETGVHYTLVGDYYLPNLVLPAQKEYNIGRFGRMRLRYLKDHRKIIYSRLLTTGTLYAHLHEVEETALERMETLIKQMAIAEGVTELLKANDQMAWVGAMNNIRDRAMEIVRDEIVYN